MTFHLSDAWSVSEPGLNVETIARNERDGSALLLLCVLIFKSDLHHRLQGHVHRSRWTVDVAPLLDLPISRLNVAQAKVGAQMQRFLLPSDRNQVVVHERRQAVHYLVRYRATLDDGENSPLVQLVRMLGAPK